MSEPCALFLLAQSVGDELMKRGFELTTAESCTGGWIAKTLTDIPGSSAWFSSGFVTYSNAAKTRMLGVPADLIIGQGAVSHAVVESMAHGALERTGAEVAIAVSGVAGPTGGSKDKPVGTVCFSLACQTTEPAVAGNAETWYFPGNRNAVRRATVMQALQRVKNWINSR